ncbi:MAG: tRNA pseudouridine(55) synthase TruB [Solirubrobacterales bacterium]|nr:tRNA pseudouridine(55) synthase TruB [Solirubrobacterales bacterium]
MAKSGSIECGIVLVDKPAALTSHDVVFDVRRKLSRAAGKRVKTGHAGTLDPFATGLLVVLVGRATRLQRYLLHQPKTYRATARLGWTSDSGDSDGELTHTGRVPADPELPTGALMLPVPKLSAIKVEGERLYAKARRGDDFEAPVREMTVYRAERMGLDSENAVFEIDCAGGTYIRSVVGTLEDAYCAELVRTKVGELSLDDADPDAILDPLEVLSHLPRRDLTAEEGQELIFGRTLDAAGAAEDEAIRLVVHDRIMGVGRVTDGALIPETNLVGSIDELAAR